jgi:hypothetical protein
VKNIERERERERLTQFSSTVPYSRDKLLPLYHGNNGDGVDGDEWATMGDVIIVSPSYPNSLQIYFIYFMFFPPPCNLTEGVTYIIGYSSLRIHRAKERGKRAQQGKVEPTIYP